MKGKDLLMKHYMIVVILLMPLIIGTACNLANLPPDPEENPISESDQAEDADPTPELLTQAEKMVLDYFSALNQADYAKAVDLYGGPYEILQGYNPTLDPEDHTALLQAGCEFNGLMCLPVREVLSVQTSDNKEFIFDVEFANPDGSAFVLGPCCGETEETMPPQSVFKIGVHCQEEGACQVMDLPPYVP
jgi:hypothetical protein